MKITSSWQLFQFKRGQNNQKKISFGKEMRQGSGIDWRAIEVFLFL